MPNIQFHRTWQDKIKLADHYKAIGYSDIYLSRHDGDEPFPWEYVTDCEPGGSHRLDIATTVRFTAKHPSGLEFSWCFDIEPDDANGKGHYQIDSAACQKVLKQIPAPAAKKFRNYLAECAVKVREKADEWQSLAARQYRDAEILKQLVEE